MAHLRALSLRVVAAMLATNARKIVAILGFITYLYRVLYAMKMHARQQMRARARRQTSSDGSAARARMLTSQSCATAASRALSIAASGRANPQRARTGAPSTATTRSCCRSRRGRRRRRRVTQTPSWNPRAHLHALAYGQQTRSQTGPESMSRNQWPRARTHTLTAIRSLFVFFVVVVAVIARRVRRAGKCALLYDKQAPAAAFGAANFQ